MKYRVLTDDRKTAVRRLEQMAGEKAVYTYLPRRAYRLRGLVFESDLTITLEEDADMELLGRLMEEELIEAVQDTPTGPEAPEHAGTAEEQPTDQAPEAEASASEETAEEEQTDQALEAEASASEDISEEEPMDPVPEAEESKSALPESPTPVSDDQIAFTVAVPLELHTPVSLKNLINTFYSRGSLLSKVTGGEFGADIELVHMLNDDFTLRKDQIVETVQTVGQSMLRGMSFEGDRIVFDGFPPADADTTHAWTILFGAINQAAMSHLRIRATDVDETNEKYAFRTWLTRLGLNGPELKSVRTILYRNLSGHTAFRTPESCERWRARRKELAHASDAESNPRQGSQVRSPVSEVESPVTEVESPAAEVEPPVAEVEPLVAELESPAVVPESLEESIGSDRDSVV